MAKQQIADSDPFNLAARKRLRAIGRFQSVVDVGYCEIHFGRLLCLASDLVEFDMSWFLAGPGKVVPELDDALFALWERYRATHHVACDEYRRRLFALFSQSAEAKYDDAQWQLNRRSRPAEGYLSGVVSHAQLSFHQKQNKAANPREYDVQVSFVVFWNEHGVTMRLRESNGKFQVTEWSYGEL